MINVLDEIIKQRLRRNWSEYELSNRSGLTQSTISNWYRKKQMPTIPILDKVCQGLGMTLSEFFAETDDVIALTPEQRELLDNWAALTPKQRELFLELIKSI